MAIVNLKELKAGKEISIPGFFGDGEEINVMLKRPSILSLAAKGIIPNTLMSAAQKVFTEEVDESVDFGQIGEVMQVVAKAALLEPTYDEFTEAGFELTDDQISHIFMFVQGGAKALENFRKEQASAESDKPSDPVQ